MKAIRLLFIVAITLLTISVNAQGYKEPILSLNGTWEFKTDPNNIGEREGWESINWLSKDRDSIIVPGNWDTKNKYSHYTGKAWFKKKITMPFSWRNKNIKLRFEGVYFDCKVWLNGKFLGSNNNGFFPFQFDIPYLAGHENTLVVCADNTFRLGALWNWGGIRRPVKLIAYNDVHVSSMHITPILDQGKTNANVSVKIDLENDGRRNKYVNGVVEIIGAGCIKKRIPFKVFINKHSKVTTFINFSLKSEQIRLWHFDNPFLYTCIIQIKERRATLHRLSDRFGLRSIVVDNNDQSFKLNGESVRLMGFNLVPDDRTTGNTLPLWRIKADIDDMKSLGCNMARLTHFPLPKEMYDYLDERGILVFPEVSLWGSDKRVDPTDTIPLDWLKKLIDNNYNHACIIGWSVGNEIGYNPLALSYVKNATAFAKTLDSTRLAVVVSHTAEKTTDIIDHADLGLVNKYYSNLGPITEKMHMLHPDKLLFYSEYGIAQTTQDLDDNINAKALLDPIRYKPFLIGASLWTYNDYRSNYPNTKGFTESRPWGVVNDFRQRKRSWYSFQKEYCPLKTIKIENVAINTQWCKALLRLQARSKLDLPAFTMNNYRVTWKLKDKKGHILSANFLNLPQIRPGDSAFSRKIGWRNDPKAAVLELALVSPLNYALSDTAVYFLKPPPPKIKYKIGTWAIGQNDVENNKAVIRVVFEKEFLAQGYKIKYSHGKTTAETPITVNSFIDIKGLKNDSSYNIQLVALNSLGESESNKAIQIATSKGISPPIIKYTEPADGGAFIGYETQKDDQYFQVRYSKFSRNYSKAYIIKSANRGLLNLLDLINGQAYFFQIRRVKENGNISPWSEEHSISADGHELPRAPDINAIVYKKNMALLLFSPIKKAVGYLLSYRSKGEKHWHRININAGQIDQYLISDLKDNRTYEFRIAAKNSWGMSNYSSIKKCLKKT